MAKAKSSKGSETGETENLTAQDTVEAVTETPETVDAAPAQSDTVPSEDTLGTEVANSGAVVVDLEDDKSLEGSGQDDDLASSEEDDTLGSGPESAPVADKVEEPSRPQPQVIPVAAVEKKSGMGSMVLGGVIAAALGFGAAQFTDIKLFGATVNPFEEEARATIQAQAQQIADLQAGLETAQKGIEIIDLNPLMTSVAGVEDALGGVRDSVTTLETQLAGFESRVTAVEKAPVAEAVSPEAIAAYERELDELRQAITDQKQAVADQRAEIEAMAKAALEAEANAGELEKVAAARGALAEVVAAAQSGQAFAAPLELLQAEGVAVPEALAVNAAEGLPSLAALTGDFPDLAREALKVARSNAPAEEGSSGIANFLANQLGARSVTPREGDDPDAVLSRAEAAVKSGNLDGAITELQALPAEAQAVLADWVARATARKDALAAAASLAQELN